MSDNARGQYYEAVPMDHHGANLPTPRYAHIHPSANQANQSVSISVGVPPELMRVLQVIVNSGRTKWDTVADLVRYLICSRVSFEDTAELLRDDEEYGDIARVLVGRVDWWTKTLQMESEHVDFEEAFEQTRGRVRYYMDNGMTSTARKLALSLLRRLGEFADEEYKAGQRGKLMREWADVFLNSEAGFGFEGEGLGLGDGIIGMEEAHDG